VPSAEKLAHLSPFRRALKCDVTADDTSSDIHRETVRAVAPQVAPTPEALI
jgi:hypothetical protein